MINSIWCVYLFTVLGLFILVSFMILIQDVSHCHVSCPYRDVLVLGGKSMSSD